MACRAATLIAAFICLTALPALGFETSARSAVVLDLRTNQTLMEKNADEPLPPASMSKLMTLNMVFEALDDGRLSLDQRLPVSEHAQSFGGSTMFLTPRDRVTVEDLIRGVVVLSGNDASVVLGEALSPDGTELGFGKLMTERARELGLTNSTFVNASGWPAEGQRMSMRDLAILAERLIEVFPQYYDYFAETEFPFDGRSPANRFNRNPLLKLNIGADGLKTGHTQEAGYGLVGSAQQGDRRIVFVISGMQERETRAKESERIVNWAFRQFAERKLATQGVVLTEADVWLGETEKVGMATTQDITLLIPTAQADEVAAKITYEGPLSAPISKGDRIAKLIVDVPGFEVREYPLVATQSVSSGSFMARMKLAAEVLFHKVAGQAASYF